MRHSLAKSSAKRVFLIHWKEEELPPRVEKLVGLGCDVEHDLPDYKQFGRDLKSDPPDAVVIDLSRLPSHGRDVAVWLRDTKGTRAIPIVFVDGDAAKVQKVKELLPDAVYTTWSRMRSALKKAIANPPAAPVTPGSMSGYSGTPLVKKLGLKADFVVALINAPSDFDRTLGKLPDGVKLRNSARGRNDLMIWFPKSLSDYESRIGNVAKQFGSAGLWVAWPKKASGVVSDLSGNIIREIGLASGLVDYKICAIDEIWSGLKFTKRA